jgi:HTH-type transcriptional regulator/antitoxin HipB
MNYGADTATQLRAVLKALRNTRGLSQADLGQLLGVNQKRIARIETDPGVTSWNQISRLISALGGRLSIQDAHSGPAQSRPNSTQQSRQAKKPTAW